jgi:alkaline phosphatase D
MKLHRNTTIFVLAVTTLFSPVFAGAANSGHAITWPQGITRIWVGPELWANRLQDWRVSDGRLECLEARRDEPMRTVHLLTRRVDSANGELHLRVETGLIESGAGLPGSAWTGFLLGAGGKALDFRAAALVHHQPGAGGGFIAALNDARELVFRDNSNPNDKENYPLLASPVKLAGESYHDWKSGLVLQLDALPSPSGYEITLTARTAGSDRVLGKASLAGVRPERLIGNVALVSHPGDHGARFWFKNWGLEGDALSVHEERTFGPIVSTQYTLSGGVLKLTAQMAPLGETDEGSVRLQTRTAQSEPWTTLSTAKIIAPGWTATVRIPDWDSARDHDFRVAYVLKSGGRATEDYYWQGRIRKDPTGKPDMVLAAFTGNANVGIGIDSRPSLQSNPVRWTPSNIWFPHAEVVAHISEQDPDLLFFSGDQVYESSSPTRAERSPEDKAMLDYLYKWYLWCWSYRDLTRDTPAIAIPDDHDIFQGNVWGDKGRHAPGGDLNRGGYVMSPAFVNMVQRTQTSNLPDPYDATPLDSGIGVYYTSLAYGGVSFAILEDRKFKSGPPILAEEGVQAQIDDGHILTPNFDPSKADVPGAVLLGARQLEFLRHWAADWKGVVMKAALSQTVFANLQTRGGKPDMDMDSDGWPQSGRARALRELRKGFALMVAGDQHLGSVIHQGVEDWNDSAYSLGVPSIANYYVRFWRPDFPPRQPLPRRPKYTGEYLDPFGNKITVWAVANPTLAEPKNEDERFAQATDLYSKAPGYGIVRFHKADRKITLECWPRQADPRNPSAQYPGWPLTFSYLENYARKPVAYLPTLRFHGMEDPVVQVVDEADGKIVYTLRIKGTEFRPWVFAPGSYTINAGEPGTAAFKTFRDVRAVAKEAESIIEVRF